MTNAISFPTVLIAVNEDGLCRALLRDLQHQGYLVLVAQDGPQAIEIARVHSRSIHLMLTDESTEGRTLALTIKQYRPDMNVLFINRAASGEGPDLRRSDTALAKVRELLEPPGKSDTELTEKRTASWPGKNS